MLSSAFSDIGLFVLHAVHPMLKTINAGGSRQVMHSSHNKASVDFKIKGGLKIVFIICIIAYYVSIC